MNPARLVTILSCLLLFIPIVSGAECWGESPYSYLGLTNLQGGLCSFSFGLNFAHVVAYTNPAGKVRIKIPNPAIGTVVAESWNFPFTGDRINGMELDVGCAQGHVDLGTLVVVDQGSPWGASSFEVEDCDGNTRKAFAVDGNELAGLTCEFVCLGRSPYNLYPPDGATNVPLNVTLSWQSLDTPNDDQACGIRISTAPDCSNAQFVVADCATLSVVLDFLQPATTYYWQASYGPNVPQCGNSGQSAMHSFTTEPPVAVEATSWGKVKALYRE